MTLKPDINFQVGKIFGDSHGQPRWSSSLEGSSVCRRFGPRSCSSSNVLSSSPMLRQISQSVCPWQVLSGQSSLYTITILDSIDIGFYENFSTPLSIKALARPFQIDCLSKPKPLFLYSTFLLMTVHQEYTDYSHRCKE